MPTAPIFADQPNDKGFSNVENYIVYWGSCSCGRRFTPSFTGCRDLRAPCDGSLLLPLAPTKPRLSLRRRFALSAAQCHPLVGLPQVGKAFGRKAEHSGKGQMRFANLQHPEAKLYGRQAAPQGKQPGLSH